MKDDPEAKAARIADEILAFVGIDLVSEMLERVERDEVGEEGCEYVWHHFDDLCPGLEGEEKPRLVRLLEELDELLLTDWGAEGRDSPAWFELLQDRAEDEGSTALSELLWERHNARVEAAAKTRARNAG
jgi:hypothetical protein